MDKLELPAEPVDRLLHFALDDDTSGYFPQLGRWHDRSRYRMFFGTLGPMAPWLREYMESQGVGCFSCECRKRSEYPLGLARLLRFLCQRRITIVHTHLFDPSVVGLAAASLARTPLRVMTRHYSDYHTRIRKRWHTRLDQLCTAMSHGVIAVSEHTAEVMRAEEGAPDGRILVIHNGVDFERVKQPSRQVKDAIRREFAPRGEFLLLQVARLHPEKGYDHLFRAMSLLRKRSVRPFRLFVAGKGPFEQSYRQMVRDLGLDDLVTFLGFRRDIANLMAAADLVVLASVAEAFGLVLTEALYLGTPIVATRVGGIPEIVTDRADGLLVPPASAEALAEAIARLVEDEPLRRRLAGAGHDKVVRTFAFERMVRRYESYYQGLLT